jgi:hypothetical protein
MAAVPNPTGVSNFTGRSDDAKGAAVFEGLWQAGAFDSQEPKEAQQLQEGRARDTANQAALRGEAPALKAVPDPKVAEGSSEADPNAQQQANDVEQADAEGIADGPEYQSLDDYLTQSKIERESFLTLPVTVKVDGKSETIALKELMEGYSREGNYTRRSQELANKQRDWEAQATQAQTVWNQNLTAAQGLFQLAQQQLFADFQGLEQLKATSPLDWAVRSQEFQQRLAQVQGHLAQLGQLRQQQEAQRQQEQARTLVQERERMLDIVPAWRDPNRFKADTADMQTFGRQLGFTEAELNQVFDHRYMQVLHYASQFLKLQAGKAEAVKRVRAAPQVSSPGTRTVRDPQRVAASQAKERWKGSKYRDQNAGAAYFETLV